MEYRINLEKQNKANHLVTELILDNCRASQISGLTDEFVNLETLSLINVGLVTLKGFPKLPKLKKLELSDNRLTGGLYLLHGSPKLQHLNISGNRIKDFDALEPLKEFTELHNLDLYNCEVTKLEDYRQKVFNLLPNLISLDGYDRDEKEVADSDESDEEGSDVENKITRDDEEDIEGEEEENGDEDAGSEDNIDEEGIDDDDDEDVDDEDDSEFDGDENGNDISDEENFDEGGDDDDEDDEDEEDYTEDERAERRAFEAAPSTNEINRGGEDSNNDDCQIVENGDDDDDDDIDGGLNDEEDYEEEDIDGSDLKQLQKDFDDDSEDDEDFEPTGEPDERDYEIDPEDDADEDEINATLSTSNNESINNVDDESKSKGTKRKLEDEGGDEVSNE